MKPDKNYYAILGIAPSAEDVIVRAAYRALAQKYHPDKGNGDAGQMALINEAYAVLSDPIRRREYDVQISEVEGAARNEGAASTPPQPPGRETSSAKTNTVGPKKASAWKRFVARSIDLVWECNLIGFGIGFVASFDLDLNALVQQTHPLLFGMIVLPLSLVLDAAVLDMFGNTPGKALLGLRVRDKDGKPLSSSDYVSRNFRLWLQGLALGIPLISLVCMIHQARKVSALGQSTYDRVQSIDVLASPIGIGRSALAYVLAGIVVLVNSILYRIEMEDWQRSRPATTTASSAGSSWNLDSGAGEITPPPQHPTESEAAAQEQAMQDHLQAIYAAHPDVDAILTSREFAAWRATQSLQDQETITILIESGSASQIIDLFNIYKRDMRKKQNTTVIEFDGSASSGGRVSGDSAHRVYRTYPYLNDSMHGDRWSGPFKAWRREYSARGFPDADFEAARTVDRFRLDGYGACYPRPGTIERGDCS